MFLLMILMETVVMDRTGAMARAGIQAIPGQNERRTVGVYRAFVTKARKRPRLPERKKRPKRAIGAAEMRPETGDVSSAPPTALYRYSTPPSLQTPAPDHFDFETDFVPFEPLSNLRIGETLGSGCNGDVFEATFQGDSVAVKQFDLSKRFDSYMNEVLAYKKLAAAWGKHVPEPLFVSASKSSAPVMQS